MLGSELICFVDGFCVYTDTDPFAASTDKLNSPSAEVLVDARFAKICWSVDPVLLGIFAQISADQDPLRFGALVVVAVTTAMGGDWPARSEVRGKDAISG